MKTLFFILLTFLVSTTYSQEIVVELATDTQLMPLHLQEIVGAGFNASYIKQLKGVLAFDLEHNGMSQLSDANHSFYTINAKVSEDKKLTVTITSANEEHSKTIEGVDLTGDLSKDRRVIHQIADAIYQDLFDERGIASTRFLYTIKRTLGEKYVSEIWEADYDGQNARPIIQDLAYNISPMYVPAKSGNRPGAFLFVSYKISQPKIFLASLKDGSSRRLISMKGNQLMPAISQQRDKIAFICDVTGNPDLFLQPFDAVVGAMGKPQQIFSSHRSAQGTPAFNPEGTKIAFVSNKDGSPRIYVLDIPPPGASLKDVSARLITKHSRESSAPAWSPDGQKLAYCAMSNGIRQIWIYDFKTKEERALTQGPGNKENPTWSTNSKCLIFNSSDHGACELYLTSLKGNPVKISSGQGEKRFPNWEI